MGKEKEGKEDFLGNLEEFMQIEGRRRYGISGFKSFQPYAPSKQGWRILQNPTSLVHRVLKAKYFAKSSFMEAQEGKNPFYIWRSLLAAKPMVQKGARWCVGDGRSIKI